MKVNKSLFPALALGVLSACSSDELDNLSSSTTVKNEAFVKVKIVNPESTATRALTRATEQGIESEYNVSNVVFAFYDNDGKFAAISKATNVIKTNPSSDGNLDATTEAVVALELNETEPKPTQVLAFVNIGNAETTFDEKDLSYVMKATVASGDKFADSNNFYMTNSTYLDSDNKIRATAAIAATDYHETKDAATQATHAVPIYVERLAAKVTVSLKEDMTPVDVTVDGGVLKFIPDGYLLNATNKTSYVVKNISNTTSYWDGWNNDRNFRCYWAEDANYGSTSNDALNFTTYDADHTSAGNSIYCLENTFNSLTTGKEYEIATHVLLTGHYELWKGASKHPITKQVNLPEGTFFMYGGVLYEPNELIKQLAQPVYSDENGTGIADGILYTLFEYKMDSNKAWLQFKQPAGGTTYYYHNGTSYAELTGDAITSFNEKQKGYFAEGFNAGKAYFPVLIKHKNTTGEGVSTSSVGYYGVVRNHHYEITINSIKGLGIGVADPSQPIHPDTSKKTYYVGSTLNVLSWEKVEQNVDIDTTK